MTVQELIDELNALPDKQTQVILFATDAMDYDEEFIVIQPAAMVNEGLYSAKPAIYITDGS